MKLKELIKEMKETISKIKELEKDRNFSDWNMENQDLKKLFKETKGLGVSTDCVEAASEDLSSDTYFEGACCYEDATEELELLQEELNKIIFEEVKGELNELNKEEIWDLSIYISEFSKTWEKNLKELVSLVENETKKEIVLKQSKVKDLNEDIDLNKDMSEKAEIWAQSGKELGFGVDDAMWTDYDEQIESCEEEIKKLKEEIKNLIT